MEPTETIIQPVQIIIHIVAVGAAVQGTIPREHTITVQANRFIRDPGVDSIISIKMAIEPMFLSADFSI
jgi:hypothetical protein